MPWPAYVLIGMSAAWAALALWVRLGTRRIRGRRLDGEGMSGAGLIYFHRPGCGACRSTTPRMERLQATAGADRVRMIDVQARPEAARRLGVRATPTALFVRDGEVIEAHVGGRMVERAEAFLRDS